MEGVRKEIVTLRQELSDRDENIMDLKKQVEASEATIKILKEKNHHLRNQILSAENITKEPSVIQPKVERSSLQPLESGTFRLTFHSDCSCGYACTSLYFFLQHSILYVLPCHLCQNHTHLLSRQIKANKVHVYV